MPLLCISSFFSASALKVDVPQQDQQAIIYVTENAVVFGTEDVTNASIVKIKAPLEAKDSKNITDSKIKKEIPIAKKESRKQAENLPKLSKPKFVFKSSTSNQNFGAGSFSNTRNSIINPVFFAKNVIVYHHTALSIPVLLYLINIYTAEFSKTAALSQFLFSRPPPFC
ncbi:hypothetical protein [Kaistella jeonii]|uniref:hypothetical protein n=1 Tax=Kaistella jeonii TaxID=266749 RepID=UPI0008E252C6|nr:hypothetical protein [Kaistella jeonii]SFC28349.1 hypothetical protein SAMN05421876_1124 [Kaistella jeonii]VEI96929.1 Uncharacterised protein [Kaistella jeonii]